MPDRNLPFTGEQVRESVDSVFSRKILGSVLVGSAAAKIVEKTILIYSATVYDQLIGWTIAFLFAILLFIYWDRFERMANRYT